MKKNRKRAITIYMLISLLFLILGIEMYFYLNIKQWEFENLITDIFGKTDNLYFFSYGILMFIFLLGVAFAIKSVKEAGKKNLSILIMLLNVICLLVNAAACGKVTYDNIVGRESLASEIDSTKERDTQENKEESVEAEQEDNTIAEQPETDEATDASITENDATTENKEAEVTGIHHVEIEIRDYGTLKVELDADTAPITVANFMKLTKEGFYDGLTFWRIMDGFMIQGGDPEGDGTGGSKETIKGEFSNNGVENNISHTRGTISMARASDPDSGSSQFFIVQTDSTFLDGEYAAFGHVTEGMEIVDEICKDANPIDDNGTIEANEQPVIKSIRIID